MDTQPVHTVAGGAHLFRRDTAARLGRIASRYLDRYAPDPAALQAALGTSLPQGTAEAVHRRVRTKLEREPVECFLIDFEDGFGARPGADEDEAAATAAREAAAGVAVGGLPPSLGIRIKALDDVTGVRALRTLELFLAAFARIRRDLPDGFAVLLPKIVTPGQVARLAEALDRLEATLGLPEKRVAIDLAEPPERASRRARKRLRVRNPSLSVAAGRDGEDGRRAAVLPPITARSRETVGACPSALAG